MTIGALSQLFGKASQDAS
jgi:hypothetical protein